MLSKLVVACAGALPLVVFFSGVYEEPTQRIAIVTANIGLLVGVFVAYTSEAGVPLPLRVALYSIVVLSLVYHLGAAVALRR